MEKLIKSELILNYLKENKLSKAKFCKMCKISLSTFYNIINNKNFRFVALFRIARVLNIKISDIFCG